MSSIKNKKTHPTAGNVNKRSREEKMSPEI